MHRAVFLGTCLKDFQDGFKKVLNELKEKGTIYTNDVLLLGSSQGSDRWNAKRTLFDELNNNTVFTAKTDNIIQPKLAFIFNGGLDEILDNSISLYEIFPIFKQELSSCLQCFEQYYGPLIDSFLSSKGPEQTKDIRYAYLFAVEYALMKLMESFGISPEITFGERIGTYIAAVTVGILPMESAVRHFVEAQNVKNQGSEVKFARVFINQEKVESILSQVGEKVFLSAVYSAEEIMLSGDASAIQKVITKLDEQGITVYEEDECGYPSPFYAEYVEDYKKRLESEVYTKPKYRFVSALSGETVRNTENLISELQENTLLSPIYYEKALESVYQQGYRFFVEIGALPNRNDIANSILDRSDVVSVSLIEKGNCLSGMLKCIAKLICLGANINWKNIYEGYECKKIILPNYPFEKTKYWMETISSDNVNASMDYMENIYKDGLKGKEINLPIEQKQYKFVFTQRNMPEIMDNSGVVHMGYYMEMLERAIKKIYGDIKYAVKDMAFICPIMVFSDEIKDILLIMKPNDESFAKFTFYSKNADQEKWNSNVQGILLKDNERASELCSINELKQSSGENHSLGSDFYQTLEQERGFYFGPSVCWVDEIWYKKNEALVRFRDKTENEEKKQYQLGLHPGIIDSCAQICNYLAIHVTPPGKKYMVADIGEITLASSIDNDQFFGFIRIKPYDSDAKEICGSVKLIGKNENTILSIDNIKLKEFDEEKLGNMKVLMESTALSKEGKDSNFLFRYIQADSQQKSELLTKYICNVMANVLETEPQNVTPDESLENFGLDSMLGLQFHNKITQLLGVELQFTDMIVCSNLENVAGKFSEMLPGGTRGYGENVSTSIEVETSLKIEDWIYEYKEKSEAKIRMFCFPNGFGSADMFREWQEKLGPFVDVCPIKLPGLDVQRMKEKPPTEIEAFMDQFVQVMEKSLFDIPCVTFGHSWGSLFAYRLANKLANNPKVDFVKLFVSGYTAPNLPNSSLVKILQELKLQGFDNIPKYEELKVKPASLEMVIKAFEKAWGYEEETTRLTIQFLLAACGVIDNYHYNENEKFNIPIVGFHGIDDYIVPVQEMYSWENVTSETFKLYTMAGDHQFINKNQSEDRLLKLLKEELYNCCK